MASPETGVFQTKDRRDDFPVFIHSELDDYGLTPIEFRVYSRLARRAGQHGKHSESVTNMAKEFEVSDRTIQRALKLLVACALIARHIRPGKTDEYSMNPRTVWKHKKFLKQTRESILRPGSGDTRDGGDMRDTGVVTSGRGVVVTPETDEGTPSEGTPLKEEERGYPFDHFAVVEYQNWFNIDLPIASAETIAVTVADNDLARCEWSDVLRTFKGNNYRPHMVGNALDRYTQNMRKIERGEMPSPLPVAQPERVKTIREEMGLV